jgi:hypothetical protein
MQESGSQLTKSFGLRLVLTKQISRIYLLPGKDKRKQPFIAEYLL